MLHLVPHLVPHLMPHLMTHMVPHLKTYDYFFLFLRYVTVTLYSLIPSFFQ